MSNSRAGPRSAAEICAVITTYRPDGAFHTRVDRVRAQVPKTIIVDDGATTDNVRALTESVMQYDDVLVQHNPVNVGVARSLNLGLSIAEANGFKWVLTLDDDTVIDEKMVEKLVQSWSAASEKFRNPIALLALGYVEHTDARKTSRSDPIRFRNKRALITSGCLISVSAFHQIGPFREEFFIDAVDYDYGLRARALGFFIVQSSEIGMTHSIGERTGHRLGPFKVFTSNHVPWRRYYFARNWTVLILEQLWTDPLFSIRALLFHFGTLVKIALFEDNRAKTLKYAFMGYRDAFAHRLGPLDAARAPIS